MSATSFIVYGSVIRPSAAALKQVADASTINAWDEPWMHREDLDCLMALVSEDKKLVAYVGRAFLSVACSSPIVTASKPFEPLDAEAQQAVADALASLPDPPEDAPTYLCVVCNAPAETKTAPKNTK